MTAPDQLDGRLPQLSRPDAVLLGGPASLPLMAALVDAAVVRIGPDSAAKQTAITERTLRTLRTGVVVVVVPPADDALLDLVATLRRERSGLRAILVDGSAAPGRRLAALEAGFDEALPARLGNAEIAGRVAIQLSRARDSTPVRLPVGSDVELDLEARALRRRGRSVHLRPLEFRLLEELARAQGRPLSRAWLLDHAWGSTPAVGSRTIDVHIRWLREKVERDPDRPVHILTVRGVGYRLESRDPDESLPTPV